MRLQRTVETDASPTAVFTYRPDGTFALRAKSKSVIARDTMEIAPTGKGSRVTYTPDFQSEGLGEFVAPS